MTLCYGQYNFHLEVDQADAKIEGKLFLDSGNSSVFVGRNAGVANTTGNFNCFFGNNAGMNNVSASANSFFGFQAGANTTRGIANAFFGQAAGNANTTGNHNCFFGSGTGAKNTIGDQNAFFGHQAGFLNTSGEKNAFFGDTAGNSNTTGLENSFFGRIAGFANTTGNQNAFFGDNAGRNNATGSNNVAIGRGAGPSSQQSHLSNRLYIDSNVSILGNDNPLIYGEFDNDFVRINGSLEVTAGLTNPSSRALKNQFVSLDASTILAKLIELDIQQWTYKTRPDELHVGPIAEDFYAAFGLGQGDKNISTIDADGIMMLAIQELNRVLMNQNKELATGIEELRNKNDQLVNQNLLIIQRLEALEKNSGVK